jgi:hypothetical protein
MEVICRREKDLGQPVNCKGFTVNTFADVDHGGPVEVGRDSTRFDETGKESTKLCRSCDALELD